MKKDTVKRQAFSPVEVATMLGCSRTLVYELIAKGKIAAKRISPGRIIVPVSEVEKLLAVNG